MKSKRSLLYAWFCSLTLIACQPDPHPSTSESKIIHGREEGGFPYVVPIQMDGTYFCTGTFISDSVLVTAAHCVEHALSVEWLGTGNKTSQIHIHSNWPTEGDACKVQVTNPKYDVALVKFPAGTYKQKPIQLLNRRLQIAEPFTIVGYGSNKITPFKRYCTLPANKQSDGLCHVLLGTKGASDVDYSYSSVLTFEPGSQDQSPGCPVDCNMAGLKTSLERDESNLKTFVTKNCDGNFRDRSYREEGVGTKRSGTNRILALEDGRIAFIGDTITGTDSVSGSGDSGGPLFILENGQYQLAGITHGGRLKNVNGSLQKLSIYADLTADPSLHWIKTVIQEEQLDVPGLIAY